MLGIRFEDLDFEKEKSNVKARKRKPFDYSKIEMSENGNKIIYGIDEIGLIFELYGKDSEIFEAMVDGKVVSGMIEESMKRHQQSGNREVAKREESLLIRCLEREKGLSI